eukprot:UN10075
MPTPAPTQDPFCTPVEVENAHASKTYTVKDMDIVGDDKPTDVIAEITIKLEVDVSACAETPCDCKGDVKPTITFEWKCLTEDRFHLAVPAGKLTGTGTGKNKTSQMKWQGGKTPKLNDATTPIKGSVGEGSVKEKTVNCILDTTGKRQVKVQT